MIINIGKLNLIYALAKRDIVGRYRGSAIGILWSFFNPILMLAVYTFVFSVVFNARWTGGSGSKTEFALVLFSGLLIYNFFAECINRAPTLIISNANYVKKVVFPLEILPVVSLISALFHFLVSLLVWLIFYVILFGIPSFYIILLPLILFPFSLMILGISWFLASLGTYVRDVSQIIGMITMIFMFMTPIFYPLNALPKEYQVYISYSPLTFFVEQARNIMIWGTAINWVSWLGWTVISVLIYVAGYYWFQKTRKGFADVI